MPKENRPRGFDSGAAQNPIDLVLSSLADATPSGNGWSVKCPAHGDKTPSLSISEGEDGRVLMRCHAGCTAAAICEALGIHTRDLFPSPHATGQRKSSAGSNHSGHVLKRLTAPTRDELVRLIAKGGDATVYAYPNDFAIVRIESSIKPKTFRPIHKNGTAWVLGDPQGPLPLYQAENLKSGETIVVCEGEKDVDRGRECSLATITSAHGANSARKSDWSVLAGSDVVIIQHNDDGGRRYAQSVATILTTMDNPATVRIIDLPGLPENGDLFDFAAKRTPAQVRAEIDKLVAATPPEGALVSNVTPATQLKWRPVPLDALPPLLREFVVRGASAIGCDPAFIALPLLSVIGSVIGTTRRIKLKNSWKEPAMIWTVVIARSGTGKSPALDYALAPLRKIQSLRFQEHDTALAEYEIATAQYDAELASWKRLKAGQRGDPPEKPAPPAGIRHLVTDVTVEALAPILQDNPRGLLLARDELAGWLGSFDRYGGNKSKADSAQWLEVHRAGVILIDRKTGDKKTIYVPMAGVSVCGTIQPDVILSALGREHFQNGLAARLLMAVPPTSHKQWNENDIDDGWIDRTRQLLEELIGLQHNVDRDEQRIPIDIPLDAEAKSAWRQFYDEHARVQQNAADDDLAAAFSKLEGYAARFALLVHHVRWATNPSFKPNCGDIDKESIESGVKLARWFVHETERVYGLLAESTEDALTRELVTFIRSKGGHVTVRDVQRGGPRELRKSADDAADALESLIDHGLGSWVYPSPGARGGAPSRVFHLVESPGDNDKTKA